MPYSFSGGEGWMRGFVHLRPIPIGEPSVKVSVEPSVEGCARGRFGKVKSSDKTLAIIDDNMYL
jgi:hypothetical protein